MLTFAVWYQEKRADGTVAKRKMYFDYLSSYLKHNSLYFQKCMVHLLKYLKEVLHIPYNKVRSQAKSTPSANYFIDRFG